MDHKAAEKTCNINNAFGPGTANEHTVEWWFNKFCKADECLEDEECSGSSWEVDNDQLRWSLRLILLQIHEKLLKNSVSTILWFFNIWRKLERWKNLVNGCLVSWPKIKIVVLKCCLLLFYATIDHFSIGLWCATKGGFYSTNTGDDQLSGWSGKKIQSISQCQTYTKKKKIGYGHCLVICCPSGPQQLSESWWNHYIWEVCSANRWDTLKIAMPTAGIGPQKGPSSFLQQHLTTCHVTKASKVE